MTRDFTLALAIDPKEPLTFSDRLEAIKVASLYARAYGRAAVIDNSTRQARIFYAADVPTIREQTT